MTEDRTAVARGGGGLGSQLDVLQAGRAVAALAVVAYHGAASADTFSGGLPDAAAAVGSYGYLGVDFFFVLSGFIIYWTNRGKSPGLPWLRAYTRSRATRVYLPYLPIGIGLAVAYSAIPDSAPEVGSGAGCRRSRCCRGPRTRR